MVRSSQRFMRGEEIESEDDVLHVPQLPTFDDRISQRDSELLLSYLTVPYMRIPLLLNFFCESQRFNALKDERLRNVLDCVMFEPGLWQNNLKKEEPLLVPGPNRDHLSTPVGLLFNELCFSPQSVVTPMKVLLDRALDIDTGRYTPSNAPLILYIIRLVTRLDGYVRYVVGHYLWSQKAEKNEEGKGGDKDKVSTTMSESYVRGLDVDKNTYLMLAQCCQTVKLVMSRHVIPMLERWCAISTRANRTVEVCTIYGHLALVLEGLKEEELDFKSVATHLCAHLMINTRYKFRTDANCKVSPKDLDDKDTLQVPETEVFYLFQNQRAKIMRWLENHPEERGKIMEAVVRVLTRTGNLERQYDGRSLVCREWRSLKGRNCGGRYVPSMATKEKQLHPQSCEIAEEPLDTEINIQFGSFTLKTRKVQLIEQSLPVHESVDYKLLFGNVEAQCAEVALNHHRSWYRLVGRRHDIKYWDAPKHDARLPYTRPYIPKKAPKWISNALEPLRETLLPDIDLYYRGSYEEEETYATLVGMMYHKKGQKKKEESHLAPDMIANLASELMSQHEGGLHLNPKKATDLRGCLKEVVVYKKRGVVQMYDVIEHGRRLYRSLVYSSDYRYCYHEFKPNTRRRFSSLPPPHELYGINTQNTLQFHSPSPSLIITRNLTSKREGEQVFVPGRFLRGLLPSVLIDDYMFWEGADGCLVGYLLPQIQKRLNLSYVIKVEWIGPEKKQALVRRIPVEMDLFHQNAEYKIIKEERGRREKEEDREGERGGGEREILTLLNLLDAEEGGSLSQLADFFLRLDNLSHILAWSKTNVTGEKRGGERGGEEEGREGEEREGGCTVDLIELPRLQLSFRRRRGRMEKGGVGFRFECCEHSGWFLSSFRSPKVNRFLDGLWTSVLLQDKEERLYILVPRTLSIRPSVVDQPLSTFVIHDRGNKEWETVSNTSHYLYPIHISHEFLSIPNFSAALYLLLLRFQARRYGDVIRLAQSCVTDEEPKIEETSTFAELQCLMEDPLPDAHACRAKLALMFSESAMRCEWDAATEITNYLQREHLVSADCRLDLAEQREILTRCGPSSRQVEKRLSLLMALDRYQNGRAGENGDAHRDALRDAPRDFDDPFKCVWPSIKYEPWRVIDTTYKSSDILTTIKEKFSSLAYTRPDKVIVWSQKENPPREGQPKMGSSAIEVLNRWMSTGGFRLRGGTQNGLSFLFFYELLSNTLTFRILPTDQPRLLAYYLTQFMPPEDTMKKSLLMSILRVLENNSILCAHPQLPKWEESRSFGVSSLFSSQSVHEAFLIKVSEFLKANDSKILWPFKMGKAGIAEEERRVQRLSSSHPLSLISSLRAWGQVGSENYDCHTSSFVLDRHTIDMGLKSIMSQTQETSSENSDQITKEKEAFLFLRETISFSSVLLTSIDVVQYLDVQQTSQEGEEGIVGPSGVLPFDISDHPKANSYIAKYTIERLKEDVRVYAKHAKEAQEPTLKVFCEKNIREMMKDPNGRTAMAVLGELDKLADSLRDLKKRDFEKSSQLISLALSIANGRSPSPSSRPSSPSSPTFSSSSLSPSPSPSSPSSPSPSPSSPSQFPPSLSSLFPPSQRTKARVLYALAQLSGNESSLRFESLVRSSLSTRSSLSLVNPLLSQDDIKYVHTTTLRALALLVRVGHAMRCLGKLSQVVKILKGLLDNPPPPLSPSLVSFGLQQKTLAGLLATKRSYVKLKEEDGNVIFEFDPRLLVFEFAQDLIIRRSQVEMIDSFMEAKRNGHSTVRQMIMGAGKTTVVGPLLALMLADGQELVVQVVPKNLLEFSRSVLRTRFSSVIRKPVFTFDFDRFSEVTPKFFRQMRRARREKAIVISTPKAVKSLSLKYVELLHELDRAGSGQSTTRQVAELRAHASECVRLLRLWRESTLVMDEVDMILHPLKSELNYPVGSKGPLDFTENKIGKGLRWELPFHLMDALFFVTQGRIKEKYKRSRRMVEILQQLKDKLIEGVANKSIQTVPHFVLLRRSFYFSHIRETLAHWLLVWALAKGLNGVSESVCLKYMLEGPLGPSSEIVEKNLSSDYMKMLNLSHSWLNSMLPHVLAKINRVGFGLLPQDYLEMLLKVDPSVPKTRRFLSVPYVGKDVPSESSEFAHPDVAIGLTILAYRYQGLRKSDFMRVMKNLQRNMSKTKHSFTHCKASHLFNSWIIAAGAKVRGGSRESHWGDPIEAHPSTTSIPHLHFSSHGNEKDGNGPAGGNGPLDIWPLRLIDLDDLDQTNLLYSLFRFSPHVIFYYLSEIVFPEVMQHQGMKISACGQELGGDMLFNFRLGFSGTPSSLLPLELGNCRYEQGADGKMVHFLTSPSIVSWVGVGEGWGVEGILKKVAKSRDPCFHALIDTGALITNMSNLEVARFLLRNGLEDIDAVVYLDEFDRKMALVRKTMRSVELSVCGIPLSRRFVFYDEVHTTGMDIGHRPDALAALTLGKDMTFRDYAQGAFRMRQIGIGQRICLLITPEILSLIEKDIGACGKKYQTHLNPQSSSVGGERKNRESILIDVAAWLVLSGVRSEEVQHRMLCQQSLVNVWRKRAMTSLLQGQSVVGKSHPATPYLQQCMDLFVDRIDYLVETSVPKIVGFKQLLDEMVKRNEKFLEETDQSDVSEIFTRLATAEPEGEKEKEEKEKKKEEAGGETEEVEELDSAEVSRAFQSEQIAEQEQEQEQEQEEEREQEQEHEEERVPQGDEEPAKKKYSRKDEEQTSWKFSVLGSQSAIDHPTAVANMFYPLSKFAMHTHLRSLPKPIQFPPYLYTSENFFKTKWSFNTYRRVKNVIVIMEWLPDTTAVAPLEDVIPSPSPTPTPTPTPTPSPSSSSPTKEGGLHRAQSSPAAPKLSESGGATLQNYFAASSPQRKGEERRGEEEGDDWIVLSNPLPSIPSNNGVKRELSAEQVERLRGAFAMVDHDGEGSLNGAKLRELLLSLDVNVRGLRMVEEAMWFTKSLDRTRVTFEDVQRAIETGSFQKLERGRHYVILSLFEAETIRGLIHLRQRESLIPGTNAAIGLRVGNVLLDTSKGFVEAGDYQQQTSIQCCRFVDSEIDYNESHANLVLRAVQGNAPDARLTWWKEVLSCRRRNQTEWKEHQIHKILTFPDDLHTIEFYACMACARGRMQQRGMLLLDAFRAFDCDRSGVISQEELYGGMTWLGIELTPQQALDLADKMDMDQDGCITFSDFQRVLCDPAVRIAQRDLPEWVEQGIGEDDEDEEGDWGGGSMSGRDSADELTLADIEAKWQGVKPRPIHPEDDGKSPGDSLRKAIAGGDLTKRVKIAAPALRVSPRPVGGLARIWDSEGSGARHKSTVWCPKLPGPSNNKIHICIGHYVSQDVGRCSDNHKRMYLTLTDTTSWRVFKSQFLETEILDVLLPHPIRFTEVWRHRRGEHPLFIWKPIPPSDQFVALGMLATPSEDPPPVTECRCVPKVWTRKTKSKPMQVWTDAGGGGRPGSFWMMNGLKLLHATEQHSCPKGEFYDLVKDNFTADYRIGDINLKWATEEEGEEEKPAKVAPPPRRRAPPKLEKEKEQTPEEKEKEEFEKQKAALFGNAREQGRRALMRDQILREVRGRRNEIEEKEKEEEELYVADYFPGMSVDLPEKLERALYG